VLSLERILRLLEEFGFYRVDAEVYLYLAKVGPQKGKALSSGLKMTKQQLYPALKRLKKKGMVTSKDERAALFSAMAFEELLKLIVRIKVDQANGIEHDKEELLAYWQNMVEKNNN
jgi:sugar-specific transcriptional regulator TrmB